MPPNRHLRVWHTRNTQTYSLCVRFRPCTRKYIIEANRKSFRISASHRMSIDCTFAFTPRNASHSARACLSHYVHVCVCTCLCYHTNISTAFRECLCSQPSVRKRSRHSNSGKHECVLCTDFRCLHWRNLRNCRSGAASYFPDVSALDFVGVGVVSYLFARAAMMMRWWRSMLFVTSQHT